MAPKYTQLVEAYEKRGYRVVSIDVANGEADENGRQRHVFYSTLRKDGGEAVIKYDPKSQECKTISGEKIPLYEGWLMHFLEVLVRKR